MSHKIDITLVRHGRSRANDEGVHEGRYDSPLTDVGSAEAEKAGKDLLARGFRCNVIIASPLQRAQSGHTKIHIRMRLPNLCVRSEWCHVQSWSPLVSEPPLGDWSGMASPTAEATRETSRPFTENREAQPGSPLQNG
jgi:broad specificity phosphatase PhoE